jgi:hypothetical protein
MNAEIKQKWLAALRSGEYQQGKSALRRDEDGQRRYCCLGVLCDLIDPNEWQPAKEGVPVAYKHAIATGMPTYDVMERVELSMMAAQKLAMMNDDGQSFVAIAKWIEEHA